MSFLDTFHFAMGWNCSAHVSFRNGLELLRPCFVLLVLYGTFISLFNVVLVARLDFFHLQSCWCSTGLLFLCLMSGWWLDSIFFIDRRELITSPCRLCDAIDPIRPRPAAGCAPDGTSVCRIRRIAIAASRAASALSVPVSAL